MTAGRLLPALVLAFLLAGCPSQVEPPGSFLVGLRVVGIVAEPPQVGPGEATVVTATAVDTTGGTPTADWQRCRLPPVPGQAVNPDCVTGDAGALLEPIGSGLTITTTMPADVTADALGQADSTGGVYLQLIAHVTSGAQALAADYRLRLTQPGQPPNQNPTIDSVIVAGDGGAMPIDEAVPLVVHSGERIPLSVIYAPGSAQMYTVVIAGAPTRTATEILTTSWFSTAGELSVGKTSDMQPITVLQLDRRLPASAARIDLYAVGRDDRGGTDVVHRVLELQ
jgi:hypothetical protein